MKFKVGDRVKVKKDGRKGFVISDKQSHYDYRVEFEDYTELFFERELELIEEDVCLYFSDESVNKIANILKSGIKTKKQFQNELNRFFSSESIEETKPIKQNRLEELIKALNTLGSLGIELDVKITAEINGKKVEL